MNINKKLDFSLRLILGLIYFFSVPYFFTLIDEKYEKSIPHLFWFIIFLISISFFIVKKNKILAYGFFLYSLRFNYYSYNSPHFTILCTICLRRALSRINNLMINKNRQITRSFYN